MDVIVRWASTFMMLESFKKAYERNAFPEGFPCPIPLEKIETYMQILLPAFKFNLIMQKKHSSIADVVHNLQLMISKWKRMKVTGNYKTLCNLLINVCKHLILTYLQPDFKQPYFEGV